MAKYHNPKTGKTVKAKNSKLAKKRKGAKDDTPKTKPKSE